MQCLQGVQGKGQRSRQTDNISKDVWRQNTDPSGNVYLITSMNLHQPHTPEGANALSTELFQFYNASAWCL